MNGKFFIYDKTEKTLDIMTAKYLCHYNDTWVLSKEPERNPDYDNATGYGTDNEWQTLYDIENETWLTTNQKDVSEITPESVDIVDFNVIGSFVDYVVRYKDASGRSLFYRERNIDSSFTLENYSIKYIEMWQESILGSYDNGESYINNFNNSVMLYPDIRMGLIGNTVVSYSYSNRSDRLGVLLIPFGDLIENCFPDVYYESQEQYIIIKTADGFKRIIKLSTKIPRRIERIAQYVHKINTVDVYNILLEKEERITIEPGSLDWNNKFLINNKVSASMALEKNTYHVNSGYNPWQEITGHRSSSMLISSTTFTLYGQLFSEEVDNAYNLQFVNTNIKNASIDVCYDAVSPPAYKYTIRDNAFIFNTLFEDLSFPDGVIVPFPITTNWNMQNEVMAIGKMSISLLAEGLTNSNKTLDLYFFSNQVYFGQSVFNLFGITYIYDGDYIYQNNDRIAMAFNYLYLGVDKKQAYFYSPWDKSIYVFTGSRMLNEFIDLSNRESVKIGIYDPFSDEMILLTESEIIKSRNGVLMNFPYKPGAVITPTKKGGYIALKDGSMLLLSPQGGEVDIFDITTGFIGVDGSTLCDYERVDVRLYSPDKTKLEFNIELQTINQDTKESEQKKIKVEDWSQDGYKTIKLIPQYKKGTGLSLRIYSEQLIHITGIEFTYNPVGRTANSERSGF